MADGDVIEFRDVCLASGRGGPRCEGLSLTLREGDAVLIATEVRGDGTFLCDAAEGLTSPTEGEILFLEQAWRGLAPARAAALRSRIGRVFYGPAWISNLDVYENLVLATRHHTRLRESQLLDRTYELAEACGVERIPQDRPDAVRKDVLQKLQWVRAFLAHPKFVILEQPCEGLPPKDITRLARLAERALSDGGAVLWTTSTPPEAGILSFTKRYALRNGTITLSGGI